MIKGKNILVTGANGFVGSWLCKSLLEDNNVIGLVRNKNNVKCLKNHMIDEKINLIEGDITHELVNVAEKVDFVIHLAAITDIKECYNDPSMAIEVNVGGTYNVLEFCRKVGVKGVIIASSTKVYGDAMEERVNEESIPKPNNVYGLTKMYSECLAKEFSNKYNIPSTTLRLANVYGPNDFNNKRLIPNTIESILGGKMPVIFSGGASERNFIYIKDAIRFFVLSLERLENSEGGVFNVGTSESYPIRSVIDNIVRVMKWGGGVDYKDGLVQAKSDRPISIEKARGLGWTPSYSLEGGLKEIIQS